MSHNKILFDGSATQGTQKAPFHGGGEYAKFVLKEALKRGYIFDVLFKTNLITDSEILELLKRYPECNIYHVSSNQEVYALLKQEKYSKFYSALPSNFKDYPSSDTLFIQVIHGLRSIELPWDKYRYKYYNKFPMKIIAGIISSSEYLQLKLKEKHRKAIQKQLSIPNSLFFTVSEHSKYALLNYFPFLSEKEIKVFYSPFDISEHSSSAYTGKPYYLMVNANRYEKNIYRAVQAFDRLISEGFLKDKNIIITGCADQAFFNKTKNPEYFQFLPYVSKERIEDLYKNAFAFVFPSLNEGFGYPPLKAMGYNVPVIASACTSIPEVCGNGALYFNPLSVDEISNRILQVEYNENIRKQLIIRGYINVCALLEKQQLELKTMLKLIFEDEMD